MSLKHGLNRGPGLINGAQRQLSNQQLSFSSVAVRSAGRKTLLLRKIIASSKAMILTPTVPVLPPPLFSPPSGGPIRGRLRARFSAITFLALEDVTAVSRPPAGLAERYNAPTARALGLVAGTQVASALWQYGGAASGRRGVTLGQDRTLGAGGRWQSGTRHAGTPQLL